MKIGKYFELHDNENKTYESLWDATKCRVLKKTLMHEKTKTVKKTAYIR